jgi:hypothetical protein
MARKTGFLLVLGVILFARAWIRWGVVAAAIVAPAILLTGVAVGTFIVWRRRRLG